MTGRFAITEILGAGAFAVVCGAIDRESGEDVAVKVLRQSLRKEPEAVARLVDEGRILTALEHPALPRCIELIEYDGAPVLVMERIRGITLKDAIADAPLPWAAAVAVGAQLAEVLVHGWEAPGEDGTPMRIVHRDLKPENALLTEAGAVKLVDFGIAKGAFAGRKAKSMFLVKGSAGFDAPERIGGASDTERVDVYGLGALILTVASGFAPMLPKRGDRAGALERHLARVDGPAELGGLLRRMLDANPARRPTMAEVVDGLGALEPEPTALVGIAEQLTGDRHRPVDPRTHKAWSEVALLEEAAPSPRRQPLSASEAAKQVRMILRRRDWVDRVTELESVLERADPPPIAPLIGVLDRARSPWWAPWQRKSTPQELSAALLLLCDRSSPAVLQRARRLLEHPTPTVSAAAQFLLAQHPTG